MKRTGAESDSVPLRPEGAYKGRAVKQRPRHGGGVASITLVVDSASVFGIGLSSRIISPVFVLLARVSRWIALGLSLSVYVVCLTFSINLPTWPSDGAWFFSPLAWQLLLVLGFIGAELARDSEAFRGWMRRLMPVGFSAWQLASSWPSGILSRTPWPYP